MFNTVVGGQISWLIPMAALGLLAGLWLTRRNGRTDRDRAGWILWGLWGFTCLAVFSLSKGIFHPYYTVQLAPSVAALAGAGGVALWQLGRTHRWMTWALPAAVVVSAGWSLAVLDRTPRFASWVRPLIVAAAAVAVVGLVLGALLRHRRVVLAGGAFAIAALLAGPAAYSLTTAAHPVSGSLVAAGPSAGGGGGGFGGAGGAGGPGTSTTDTALVSYLEANQGTATYLVAASGSQTTASIIIAMGKPVITIGGFNGGDPAPTLAQFQQLVAEGKVRFLLVSNGGGGPGGGGSAITTWAASVGTKVTVTGSSATLYDLSAVVTGASS
jgi:4-amino-4-deoxy-L-arabinose transferase-like glycosyltransferase